MCCFILRATPSAGGPFWLFGIAIWGAWWLLFDILGIHFGTAGAPWGVILAPRDHPGGPWEQQDGLEVVQNRISIDFAVILGPYFESLFGTEARNSHFVPQLFPGQCFSWSLCLNFNAWGS